MLTIRTSYQAPANRHRSGFRDCACSTGIPLRGNAASRSRRNWIQLLNSESRRLWLSERWNAHMQRVRLAHDRRQSCV